MKISNHYRIENRLGAFIYLDQDELNDLVAILKPNTEVVQTSEVSPDGSANKRCFKDYPDCNCQNEYEGHSYGMCSVLNCDRCAVDDSAKGNHI